MQANDTLTSKSSSSEVARERAQQLLQRASRITVDTTSKLRELKGNLSLEIFHNHIQIIIFRNGVGGNIERRRAIGHGAESREAQRRDRRLHQTNQRPRGPLPLLYFIENQTKSLAVYLSFKEIENSYFTRAMTRGELSDDHRKHIKNFEVPKILKVSEKYLQMHLPHKNYN